MSRLSRPASVPSPPITVIFCRRIGGYLAPGRSASHQQQEAIHLRARDGQGRMTVRVPREWRAAITGPSRWDRPADTA